MTGNGGRECDRKVERIKDLVHAEIKVSVTEMLKTINNEQSAAKFKII